MRDRARPLHISAKFVVTTHAHGAPEKRKGRLAPAHRQIEFRAPDAHGRLRRRNLVTFLGTIPGNEPESPGDGINGESAGRASRRHEHFGYLQSGVLSDDNIGAVIEGELDGAVGSRFDLRAVAYPSAAAYQEPPAIE